MKTKIKYSSLFWIVAVLMFSSCSTTQSSQRLNLASEMVGPVEYIPVMTVCEVFDINYEWDAVTKKNILYKNDHSVSFKAEDRNVSIDGHNRTFSAPPLMVKGNLMIPKEMAQMKWWKENDSSFIKEVKSFYPGEQYLVDKVVIDPGHGGKDLGAIGVNGIPEKDVNLQIARKLRDKLQALGFRTVMTRDGDYFISLAERSWIGNNSGGDLFISVHANSAPDRSVSGTEIYILTEDMNWEDVAEKKDRSMRIMTGFPVPAPHIASAEYGYGLSSVSTRSKSSAVWDTLNAEHRKESTELAGSINSSLKRYFSIKSRGVKDAKFFVLRWTDKPAVLVEAGFMTNSYESRQLANPAYQDQFAGLLAEGIMSYKEDYERTRGFTAR